MNAKIICRPKSGGTPGQGCPSIVAPQASYAVEFSQHTAKLLLLTQQTALLITGDKKTGTENPRAKRKEYHQHTRINTLNYPSTKAGQVQSCNPGSRGRLSSLVQQGCSEVIQIMNTPSRRRGAPSSAYLTITIPASRISTSRS